MEPHALYSQWIDTLFSPEDLVEFRWFPPKPGKLAKGEKNQRWVKAADAASVFASLTKTNEKNEIYAGMNPRAREGGKAEDVALARCLAIDIDDFDASQTLNKIDAIAPGFPSPTLIVASGHGAHAYWRLSEPLDDLALWRSLQTRLIALFGSDDKIKDPPRVMRVPGFTNHGEKAKGETPTPVTLVGDVGELVDLEDIVSNLPEVSVPGARLETAEGKPLGVLARTTLEFLALGARDGERNSRLMNAACDLAGNGYAHEVALGMLMGPAQRSGLEPDEISGTVASAFSKPRTPIVVPDGPIATAMQMADITSSILKSDAESGDGAASAILRYTPAQTASHQRVRVTNVVDGKIVEEEGERAIRYYVPLPAIHGAIQEATRGWPRRAGGILFAMNPDHQPGDLATGSDVLWILECDAMFAWLQKHTNVRWASGDAVDPVTKDKLTPPTKREAFAYLLDNAGPTYRAVEILPHEPPLADLFYVPCKLPEPPAGLEMTPLLELLMAMNAETETDRWLLLAAMMTPGWGGPEGTRPAFVFTSAHGRGVGKTTTAEIIAEIWGGSFNIGTNEDWDQIRKRMLSDDALTKRVVLIDNIKGKMDGADIEGLITSKVIDGWKPYHGQASRPNFLTWFLTANTPSLSEDLADRSIIIRMGQQKHGTDFKRWARDHISQHRATIIAELLAILKRPARSKITTKDRWTSWQEGVLAKLDAGAIAATEIVARRPGVSADRDDQEELAHAIVSFVAEKFFDHDGRKILISRKEMYRQLCKANVIDKGFSPKGTVSWLRNLANGGALHFLKEHRQSGGRGWLFVGEHAGVDTAIDPYPESADSSY